jgi:wobble nucleotide-excising tRNase
MIKKLDISKFGLFNSFSWDASIGRHTPFKRLNIIYGRNYSGKTTLSRILRCIEKGEIHNDYKNANFSIEMYDSSVINSSSLPIPSNAPKIRVYNTDFVKDNLSWVRNPEGTIEPFTILGNKNVEIENKIKAIDTSLGSEEEKKGLLFDLLEKTNTYNAKNLELKSKTDSLTLLLKNKANNEIKTNPDYFLITPSKKTYQITDIENEISKLISNPDAVILTTEKKEEKRKQLKEEPKPDIELLALSKPQFEKYKNQTQELLSALIKPSQTISELINDSLLQEWVRQGIEKHRDKRETCAFCGSLLPKDLWDKLDAHFSKESKDLRDKIQQQIEILDIAKQKINSFISLSKDSFYVTYHTQFDELFSNWQKEQKQYAANIEILITELREREKDIFKERGLTEISDNSDSILVILTGFNKLIEENNNKAQTLINDQSNIRKDLRFSEIAEFVKKIDYSNKQKAISELELAAQKMKLEKDKLDTDISKFKDEKRSLEAQAKDESKGAELVNQYLMHYFGHNDFKLVAEGQTPNIKFKIKRGDEEALNLSEGECSLISFCYFIARMEDEMSDDQNANQLIIYIDDPISSLDNNHIFFMFSLIESVLAKPKKYSQLFISTHNLDFLNYLKGLTIPKSKEASQDNEKNSINHFLVERKGKCSSNLCLIPDYFKKYVTEFNYLFGQIHKCSVADDETIANSYQYDFSNNMRKFLEGYLFYRYPSHNLNLTKRLNKFFDNNTITVNLINRVVNEYSHLEEHFDRSIQPIDIDIIKGIANAVIDKIKEKDPEQYNSLCESVNIPLEVS